MQLKLEQCIDDERQFKTAKRPQAPGDATVRKRFPRLSRYYRSKRIAFLESVNFLRVSICNFSIYVMVTWPLFGNIRGLYLPNAWSQTLQNSKRHSFSVSAFHRYNWFGAKLFLV